MGGSEPGSGGRVHVIPEQPGLSADCLPACLPQDGGLPLHSQYVSKFMNPNAVTSEH